MFHEIRVILFGGYTKQFTSSSSFSLIFVPYPAECFDIASPGFASIVSPFEHVC